MSQSVAIVGCPNAGKSTLFNRLIGERRALVSPTPGMTRDVREGQAQLGDLNFRVLDTAGHDQISGDELSARLRDDSERVAAEADVCLFVVDARAGVTAADLGLADVVRRTGTPVIVVANKIDTGSVATQADELWDLGLGPPVRLSAEHDLGFDELYEALAAVLDGDEGDAPEVTEPDQESAVRLALLGRPNVGKSTLANALLGQERLVTGPEAGITRDAIAVSFRRGEQEFRLFDTAGLRRRVGARSDEERLAVDDALRAVRFCEVAVLVFDATIALEQQDLRLASLIEQEGRAVVVAVNKWDLVKGAKRFRAELQERLSELLPNLAGVTMVPVSALHGQGLDDLMQSVLAARETWERRVGTGELNRWLREVVELHPPKAFRGRRIRIRYVTQTGVRPPTFAVFASRPQGVDHAYRRYLINRLREDFGLAGIPIRLMVRGGDNPYAS